MSIRCRSCARMTSGPPMTRRSAPSSSTAHTFGGSPGAGSPDGRSWPWRGGRPRLRVRLPSRITARAYSSVCSRPGTNCSSYSRMKEAAASSPKYGSTQCGRMSEYACHQPGVLASAGQVEQRLALVARADPVEGQQVGDVALLEPDPAVLHPADLRVRAADARGGPLGRHACLFAEPAQVAAEHEALHCRARGTRAEQRLRGLLQAESSGESIATPRGCVSS